VNTLPIIEDITIRQGRQFALPFIITDEAYDDVTGEIVESGPWNTAGMIGRFTIRPIVALGELGEPVIDASTTDGLVELGIQGIPGLEVCAFIWLPASITDVSPWGIGWWEFTIDPEGGNPLTVGEGRAVLQRKSAFGPEV
jgi:hypothetical protein